MREPGWVWLRLTVFTTGAAVLALELLASRYLSPGFGASIYIWGAILSVTLLALSVGYRLGGRLADRAAAPGTILALFIIVSAGWIGGLPLFGVVVLDLAIALGALAGPPVAVLLLFSVPLTALATATPLAFGVRFRQSPDTPGDTLGGLFALSTAGSIAGALLAAYLAIPLLGLQRSLLLTAGALLLVVLPRLRGASPALWLGWMIAGLLIATSAANRAAPAPLAPEFRFIERGSSAYGQIDVVADIADDGRVLVIDGATQNWVIGPALDKSLFFYVTAVMRNLSRFDFGQRRALVLGLGAGTLPRKLRQAGFAVSAVEIDRRVVEAARTHFQFDPARFEILVEDGRPALRNLLAAGRGFDLIVLDVAGAGTQPAHLFTVEAFAQMKALLGPDGVLMANLLGPLRRPHDRLQRHVVASLRTAFGWVEAIQLQPNLDSADDVANLLVLAARQAPPRGLAPRSGERLYPVEQGLAVLTDDRNPALLWSIDTNAAWHRNVREWLGAGVAVPQ